MFPEVEEHDCNDNGHVMKPVEWVQCAAVLLKVNVEQKLKACYHCGYVTVN